ncbi:MAG: penicillin acylase family protein [Alteromonadaceae bacterium]
MISIKNIIISVLLILFLVVTSLGTWIYSQIDSALPVLEGKRTLLGLSDTAIVERDIQGIVTIKAKKRNDVAVATGFIHAQERFFQMDLLRRNSAGELASLFGEKALPHDKEIRRHRFRERARVIVSQLPRNDLALLKAYTRGVNQGISNLKSAPFEYLLLQQEPVSWQEEDTVLTVLSMYMDLQYAAGDRERTLGNIKNILGEDVFKFLNPKGSIWDAAIDGSQLSSSAMPTRSWPSVSSEQTALTTSKVSTLGGNKYQGEEFPGSNNWAVSGDISKTGSAIVANDMHLGIRVPNTWFRATFQYESDDDESIKVTGLTLPGTPNIIAGSNGNIAWGFTNSYGDWSDIIILDTNDDKSQYLTPTGYQDFTQHKQIIAVKDQDAREIIVKETIWGPVIGTNSNDQLLAYRWVAHDVQAVNLHHTQLELAKDVDDALVIASKSGIPAQNLMVGDKAGNIGWTIMGPIPKKSSQFGETPTHWADGINHWQGYLSSDQYPKIKNPENNRLWTANTRVVGGEMLEKIGNGGYALGARAQQIRDNLIAIDTFSEQDLLNIALDDRAIFLQRWQAFLLKKVLTPQAIAKHPDWQAVKKTITTDNLCACIDSVAYRLVNNFRLNVRNDVFSLINENLFQIDNSYSFRTIRHQLETPLWQMVNEEPENFLWLPEATWPKIFEKALTSTLTDMTENQTLTKATWGQQNTSTIQHPLSNAVPFIGRWLDMPPIPLPGDSYMPRIQGKGFGASERMVVSPGHEESGILHMPTSQSGHPWSPYYGLGHDDWVKGNPSPFLPGETKYTLTLLSY